MFVIYLCYSVAKIKQKSEISLYYFANCLYFLCKTQKKVENRNANFDFPPQI